MRAALRRLNVWRAQAAQPVLLYLLDLRDRGLSSSDEVATAVSYVESFLVRRMICGVPTNNLNRIFNAAVQELPRDVGVAEGLRFVLSGERRFWPTDAELREAILSKPFYWQGRAEQRRLVLQRLEESYGSREPIDWTAALSIEHVLPQTPSEEWLTSLASDVREGESTLDVHRRLVHTLGNLTLTGYNPVLSNGLFDQKKELLRKSGLHMNQRIAEATSWGPAEVKARGEELTEHAIRLWPGPVPVAPRVDRDWTLLHQALAALPPGSWTTYGDLAALIGSHPVPVGSHISTTPVPNAHRVLDASGRVVQGFHWLDPADQRDPAQMLRDEGVIFDEVGRADPAQRMVTQELAALVNLDVSEPSDLPNGVRSSATEDSESRQRFLRQLDGRGPQIAAAVQRLMETWIRMGGRYRFGPSAEITCALVCGGTTQPVWPMIVYPSTASIEVSFKPVSKRPPFDESPMRLEFLSRLNQAPGVAIPAAKIDLYPTFQCSVLLQQEAFDAIADALRWFIEQVNAHGAQPAGGTSADDA